MKNRLFLTYKLTIRRHTLSINQSIDQSITNEEQQVKHALNMHSQILNQQQIVITHIQIIAISLLPQVK